MPQQTKTQTKRERFDAIIINHFGLDEAPPDGADFLADFESDSLDLVEVAMEIEDEFDVSIDDGELERAVTVGDLYKLVA